MVEWLGKYTHGYVYTHICEYIFTYSFILTACQFIKDYFMLKGEGIAFIEHSYLHFCVVVSSEFGGGGCRVI